MLPPKAAVFYFSSLILRFAVPTTLIGGYLGGKLAVKKGNVFVVNTMIASALALIFGIE